MQRLRQLEAEAASEGLETGTGRSRQGSPAAEVEDPLAPVQPTTVRAIQRELTNRGYDPGPVDGNIGLMTRAAIMAFEHDEGLALTGEPTERLLRQIVLGRASGEQAAEGTTATSGEHAQRLIRSVQQALATLNYAPGQADGTMTDETERAIREFEMDQGLVPSGRVSGRLIMRLARAAGKGFTVPVR